MIPEGLCQCGCGEQTEIVKSTHSAKGLVKGEPRRYLTGHHRRKRDHYEVEDRGYKTPCWVWKLSGNQAGYGRMKIWGTNRTVVAYRWYYEQKYGLVPRGLQLDHLCRNRGCVNPDHLEPISRKGNVRRGAQSKVGYARAFAVRLARATTTLRVEDLAEMFALPAGTMAGVLYKRETWGYEELKGETVI